MDSHYRLIQVHSDLAVQLNSAVNKGIQFLEERCDQNGFQYDSIGKDCLNFKSCHGEDIWPLENHLSMLGLEFVGRLLSSSKLQLLTDFAQHSTGPKEINHFVNHVWLPNDTENSAMRISYFLKVGLFSIENTLEMAKHIISNIVPETGEIQLFFPPRGPNRENRIDFTSSCITMRFLYMVGMRDEAILTENAIFTFLVSGSYKSGCSYYFPPECFLLFCAHAVNENSAALERFKEPLFVAVRERLHELLLLNSGQSQSVLIALLVLGLSYLNMLSHDSIWYLIQDATSQLLALQNADGSWPKASIFRARRRCLYPASHVVSNIFCSAALNAVRKIIV